MKKSGIVLALAVSFAAISLWLLDAGEQNPLNSGAAQVAQVFRGKIAKKECPQSTHQREFSYEPYYTGPLVDAHIHMPVSSRIVQMVAKKLGNAEFNLSVFDQTLTKDRFACLFTEGGVRQLYGLFLTTRYSLGAEIQTIRQFQKNYPGLVVASFMPVPVPSLRVATKDFRETLDKNPGLFRGIGELKLFDNSSIDNPYFTELYQLADAYGLIIMIHPHYQDKETMKKILKQYPRVTFLLHGGDDPRGPSGDRSDETEFIADIIKNYPNAYYSLGPIQGLHGSKREHTERLPEKTEILPHLHSVFESELKKAVSDWKALIERYPERFMWETDRHRPQWVFDEDVGRLLEEFARSFIGKLAPEVQEGFAYKNAERLFAQSE